VLSQMETMLQNYLKNLTETTAAKERIESELSIAHKIQMGILPRDIPAFPDHDDFDLYVIMEPAKEVGGDLYDYFMLDENRLFFLIGDVSDKGVPAALFMAVTKTLFKSNALSGNASVDEIMGKVNQDLSHGNPWQMFVTVFAGVLDLSTGEIIYSDGGHEPPIILRANKDPEIIKKKGGPALCFFEDYHYECGSLQLNPGDSIVLYTDGVTEAMNKERTLFGAERIKKALTGYQAVTPLEILTMGLFQNVKIFAGGEPQSDDIAILTIQYFGPDYKKKSEPDHNE
jgi:phosphoserine phosphatase RsbU/P